MAKTETPETAPVAPAAEPLTAAPAIAPAPVKAPPQPGCVGYVDTTPLISVTSDVEGYSPGAGVLIKKGSHKYTHAEAAALVSHGLGRVSAKERTTLEAAGLLKSTTAEGTKE